MSRTDNTRHWRFREAERPELPWWRILNTQMNAWGRRETRRFWHSERHRVSLSLRQGDWTTDDDPAPTRSRHGIRWDMY